MLKKIILLSTFILYSVSSAQVENLMEKANKHYQEEQFNEAIVEYNKIIDQGYVSDALFYNLGNSYFRINQLGYAILNYERGLKLSPNDDDLKYNLEIANARTVDKIKNVPKLFITEWWELLLTSLSINGWSVLVSLSFITLLLSLTFYFVGKSGRIQRIGFMSGSISFAVFVLFIIILFSVYNREMSTDYGVVIKTEVSAKQTPDQKSSDVFIIHEGLKFELEDKVNDWSKIRLSDGKVGWLPNNSFEKI
ncbi:MAG: hypothetical protein CVV23_00185 [Ignavibacteriae bacterium HGW-Ignavibacteriae-2]|jgi:tetratricopeptide (TPR) repeat protein|nr:MAG: hypothetical protein CVV23_00185 [Ignavibacteriae bacterium HGW-Ignavibacteriae-2]